MNELERSLVALGRELSVPEAPDLAPAVLARLEPHTAPRPRPLPLRRRWAVAVVVALLAALGATLAIPDARSAFLRIFAFGGERIEVVEELPDVRVEEDFEFLLGERVTLAEARARSDFELRELESPPDRAYLGERGTVWFLYGTPAEVQLLVSQTPFVSVDEPALLKKLAGGETSVEAVSVDGARGVFLSGEPHFLFFVDERGLVVEESARLAEDVLVWDEDGVTYRLEGDFGLERALALARELR